MLVVYYYLCTWIVSQFPKDNNKEKMHVNFPVQTWTLSQYRQNPQKTQKQRNRFIVDFYNLYFGLPKYKVKTLQETHNIAGARKYDHITPFLVQLQLLL